jgi:hypothetical protein
VSSETTVKELVNLLKDLKGYRSVKEVKAGPLFEINVKFDSVDNAIVAHDKLDGYEFNKNGNVTRLQVYRLGIRSFDFLLRLLDSTRINTRFSDVIYF